MKILMIHPHEVYSSLEPWTTRITNLAKEFIKAGHAVKLVYFPLVWEESRVTFKREGIELIPLCRRAGILNIARNCQKVSALAGWADIVHLQKCFHYASIPAILASWVRKKPLHYDWDDWEEMIYYESASHPVWGIGLFLRILETNLPSLADTVSVSSQHLYSLCLKLGVSQERIFHVPVGADLQKFNPSVRGEEIKKMYNITRPLVLYIGQLHGGQYVKLFIQAAKILLRKGVNADFMIVGDGARAKELKQLAANLGLAKKIVFTGAVESEKMPEYIASGEIAVACFEDNPVTRCKSPLKIAEYLACGKAIVASNVGEVQSMIAEAGVLVDPGNAVSLAENIDLLLSNQNLRDLLKPKARKRAEDIYNWRVSANTLLSAYQVALGNGALSSPAC